MIVSFVRCLERENCTMSDACAEQAAHSVLGVGGSQLIAAVTHYPSVAIER
jgi:hypothetical protein